MCLEDVQALMWPYVCVLLTVEGQISKQSSQQIHDKHAQERDICNVLHLSSGTTADRESEKELVCIVTTLLY